MAGGKPIETVITTDVSDVVSGADKVADSYKDIQDSLKDTAKASDKASQSMQDDVKDSAKVIDRDLTKALKEVDDTSKSTGHSVGRNVKEGTDKAGEGMSELRDESKSTAREAAASFSNISDAADALQEIAANAFAGFGPAGMAAGIVAAAGIGLAISALQDNADQINANKQKMLDLAQVIRDNGGVLTDADYVKQMDDYGYAIQDTKEWFEIFQADAISGFEKLKKASDATGLSARDIFEGGFGNVENAKKTLDLVSKKLQETKDKAEALYNLDGSIDPVSSQAITTLEDYKKQTEQNIRTQEAAADIERQRKNSIAGTTEALREDIAAMQKHDDLMKGSVTSELDYMDGMDNLTAKLADSGNAWNKNTQAGRDNQRAVLDVTSDIEAMAQSQLDAGTPMATVTGNMNAQADALATKLAPAFGGSKDAARKYIDTVLQVPKATVTTVTLQGEAQVRAKLDGLRAPIGVLINPIAPSETYFQGVLNQLRGRSVPVMLTPKLGQGSGV